MPKTVTHVSALTAERRVQVLRLCDEGNWHKADKRVRKACVQLGWLTNTFKVTKVGAEILENDAKKRQEAARRLSAIVTGIRYRTSPK